MSLIDVLENLSLFVDNGGRYNKGIEPKFGEPFYDQYRMLTTKRDFSVGDKVSVVYSGNMYQDINDLNEYEWMNCEKIEGIVLSIDVYDLVLLVKGKKVWANRQNVRHLRYANIVSVSLIEKVSEDFNLQEAAPSYVEKESGSVTDIYGNCDRVRNRDKDQFLSLYPEVSFDESHIICVFDCSLYWPFRRERVAVNVYLAEDDGTVISRIPCKIGCTGNTFFAGNYYDKEHDDLRLLSYLPRASKQYENINVVCVWTVATSTDDGSLDIVLVDVHHFDKIEPVVDNKNILNFDMRARTYIGYGAGIFEKENSRNLVSLMDNDNYFVMDAEEDYAYSIKYTNDKDIDKYSYLAMLAISDFDLARLLSGIYTGYDMCRNFEVTVKSEPQANQYYSTMWRHEEKRYQFKILD